jgi:hypothetical protein
VGEDKNGMPLTVLSALARVDVDPWEEASKLTQLPQESAVTQLASLLGAPRNVPVEGLDSSRIAAALIALLPPFPRDRVPPVLKAAHAQAGPIKNPAVVSTLLTVMTFVIFMMLSQWLMGGLEAARPVQPPPIPVPATESPSTPTSSEGRQNVK